MYRLNKQKKLSELELTVEKSGLKAIALEDLDVVCGGCDIQLINTG